jgi:uncharacterized protein YxjI
MSTFLQDRSGIGVQQRLKVFDMRHQYELAEEAGQKIGAVEQVNQSPLTFIVRLMSDMDVALPVTLVVSDAAGGKVLELRKPWFRYAVTVTDAGGTVLGVVRKRVRIGKAVFTVFGPDGTTVLGEVKSENWRARNFRIDDAAGTEIARVTKQWRGLATELFTDADSYAVTFEPTTAEPMRSLALAAAFSVDLTMKQKDY